MGARCVVAEVEVERVKVGGAELDLNTGVRHVGDEPGGNEVATTVVGGVAAEPNVHGEPERQATRVLDAPQATQGP